MRALVVVMALAVSAQAAPNKHDPGAVVLVIDRSGSMQGPKLDAAKDALRAVFGTLEPDDEIEVVVFDSEATILLPLHVPERKKFDAAVDKIVAGGGTNIYPALKETADSLRGSKLKHKHVVLMTDGEAPSDGIPELVHDMRGEHITISCIGVQGADRTLLAQIADGGDGRLYMVDDAGSLPKVFVKEVAQAFGR